ncbi:MAG: hypothetical protein ACOCT9_00845 [archaeon]
MGEDLKESIIQYCSQVINNGIKPLVRENENGAYIFDPVLEINRNRVNAEILKSITRLEKLNVKIELSEYKGKLLKNILHNQNNDGSWNEIHSNYDEPSALLTSFVAEAFLLDNHNDEKIISALKRAKDYVLSKEYYPGYFKKSNLNYADCLNVNATCGSFLARYGDIYNNKECLDAAERAAHRVCHHQFSNGAYPYTTKERGYPYPYHYYVPCIHYQGVTMFFLSKIHSILEEEWIKKSLMKGCNWLSSVQDEKGKFDWSKSGLMYAYTLAGSYAFATSSFVYTSQWDDRFLQNAKLSLNNIQKNTKDIVNRWEEASMISILEGIIDSIKTTFIGDYPISHRLFRLGYGMYKQFARRRYSEKLEDKMFNKLSSLFNIESTWVEPSKNYPDLFNTSEVLDCLTSSLVDE